jgi:aspartyl protease family protein
MLIISCVLGLGLLALFFDNVLERRANPNQNPVSTTGSDGSVEVELRRNQQGHYVAGGLVNDARAVFLLDTGATDVVLPEELALTAGLERGAPTRASTANGDVVVYSATIAKLQIGDILLTGVRASINPAMTGNTVLLGMSALRHVEFTQRGDQLTLRYIP